MDTMDICDVPYLAEMFYLKYNQLEVPEQQLRNIVECSELNNNQLYITQFMLDIVQELRYLYRRATWAARQVAGLDNKLKELETRIQLYKNSGTPVEYSLFIQLHIHSEMMRLFWHYWIQAVDKIQTSAPKMTTALYHAPLTILGKL